MCKKVRQQVLIACSVCNPLRRGNIQARRSEGEGGAPLEFPLAFGWTHRIFEPRQSAADSRVQKKSANLREGKVA